ncbi:batten's disease protein Cln3 [Athelia psychrophila]|uniref:Protein BTN n=1 Tax=Athelia psychrophila TaxID=1759441 RepID=A0A166TNJ0_9AGAM|nr:batten's disease protein Cln3 [Fibularhizoctonia sp. CBS 109695]
MLSTPTTNQEHHELDTMDSDYRQARDHPEGEGLLLSQGDEAVAAGKGNDPSVLRRLGISFFLFGLINNVLYVVILSAALDLVPSSTPKGLILFFNIFPSLIAKALWPYISKGTIRYGKRITAGLFLSVGGIAIVALFENVYARLFGIGFASFASGLGELTFLQLSTTYNPPSIGGKSVGYFASGTGAAGLVGALLWWEVRSLGVRTGVGISAILPFITPLTFLFLLPPSSAFSSSSSLGSGLYVSIPTIAINGEDQALLEPELEGETASAFSPPSVSSRVTLTGRDKWRLVKPLLGKYMLPLFCVYLLEYTINQGIAPTLLYPVPAPLEHPIVSKIIRSIRDYYPLWQLVYQTAVFFSRSTISIGIPPLPQKLIWLPGFIQLGVLIVLGLESATGLFESAGSIASLTAEGWEGASFAVVFLLIAIEGICGGLAYVNVFYHINQMPARENISPDIAMQEREFQIGSVGFADSLGILAASLLAMPTELELCKAQVRRGKMLCKAV